MRSSSGSGTACRSMSQQRREQPAGDGAVDGPENGPAGDALGDSRRQAGHDPARRTRQHPPTQPGEVPPEQAPLDQGERGSEHGRRRHTGHVRAEIPTGFGIAEGARCQACGHPCRDRGHTDKGCADDPGRHPPTRSRYAPAQHRPLQRCGSGGAHRHGRHDRDTAEGPSGRLCEASHGIAGGAGQDPPRQCPPVHGGHSSHGGQVWRLPRPDPRPPAVSEPSTATSQRPRPLFRPLSVRRFGSNVMSSHPRTVHALC